MNEHQPSSTEPSAGLVLDLIRNGEGLRAEYQILWERADVKEIAGDLH